MMATDRTNSEFLPKPSDRLPAGSLPMAGAIGSGGRGQRDPGLLQQPVAAVDAGAGAAPWSLAAPGCAYGGSGDGGSGVFFLDILKIMFLDFVSCFLPLLMMQ